MDSAKQKDAEMVHAYAKLQFEFVFHHAKVKSLFHRKIKFDSIIFSHFHGEFV